MAFLSSMFHTPKPKQFQYKPMYYDERKERLEKMKADAEAAGKSSTLQRGFLNEQRESSKLKKISLEKVSILRFLVILALLSGIMYFLLM